MNRFIVLGLFATALGSSLGTSLEASAIEIDTITDYQTVCADKKPLVLFFYAPWCNACKGMKSPFDAVAKKNSDINMAKINIENKKLSSITDAFNITVIPTIVTRQTGALTENQLQTMVQGHKKTAQRR